MTLGIPDGFITGDGRGNYCRVFRPRWWQLWRWLYWAALPPGRRGEVDVVYMVPLRRGEVRTKRVRAVIVDAPMLLGKRPW